MGMHYEWCIWGNSHFYNPGHEYGKLWHRLRNARCIRGSLYDDAHPLPSSLLCWWPHRMVCSCPVEQLILLTQLLSWQCSCCLHECKSASTYAGRLVHLWWALTLVCCCLLEWCHRLCLIAAEIGCCIHVDVRHYCMKLTKLPTVSSHYPGCPLRHVTNGSDLLSYAHILAISYPQPMLSFA